MSQLQRALRGTGSNCPFCVSPMLISSGTGMKCPECQRTWGDF